MGIDFSAGVALPDDVLIRRVEQESVILNLESGRYFGLDDTGTTMLRALEETDSIQAAFDKLLSRYEVESEVLRSDLQVLLDKLIQAGLLELRDS